MSACISGQAAVTITEFMANNSRTLMDQDREYSDWIELFNDGAAAVNLEGWYLTDSTNQLARWRFPNANLPAGGYLVVFASGKNRAIAGAQLHTSFSLAASGEYLALIKPDGTTVASEYVPEFPPQQVDISYGLFQGTPYYFSKPSPGQANTAGFISFVADTKFSVDRGFHEAPFNLEITAATEGATIRYTTNGTQPSTTNGLIYTAPILIDRTTVIRAAAFKTSYLPSNVDTHTYLFLDDVIRQSADGRPPAGWPTSWGGNTVDYGMDPDVVNNAAYSATIKNDLKTIPSFSLVMDLKDLFNSSSGIYANPGQDGAAWERPTSVELIHPNGEKGFQINAGIRIRGGFSRSTSNPKHAFRLFFREEYGAAKLRYPLFGDQGADTFDCIDLRTFQNYSWSFQGDSRGVFLRDQFSRDAQLAMGHPGERGQFYHLYINGQYWGLFNTCERPEASFGETYLGGQKENYDVLKVESGPYTVNATDGNMSAWTRLYNMAKAGFTNDIAYQKVLGNNPDGSRNPQYERLIEPDNLIDYLLVIFYGGNLDAPISNFLGNTRPNNWYGMRDRTGTSGFYFFAHDAEHTLLNVNENRTGPYTAGDSSVNYSSPQWIFQKLVAHPEFRMLVTDRIHKYFFNSGLLTPESARSLFIMRKNQIDRAVIGESARWGDAKRATPFTRDKEWVSAINTVANTFFPSRTTVVLNQFKTKGWYPNVTAPSFNQHGGNVQKGFSLSMTAPSGTIYYTIDNSDPRLPGGEISPTAKTFQSSLVLQSHTHVKSRVLSGTTWSALNEASFIIIQTFNDLVITEIMYHPAGDGTANADDFEFIELKNVSGSELDLSGIHFTDGINFTFPNGTLLQAGHRVVLVNNPTAFSSRYPGVKIDGIYMGRLANEGEKISLVHAAGTNIVAMEYKTGLPWPMNTDGEGFSLVLINPDSKPDASDPVNWKASSVLGGTPGSDEIPVGIVPVIINEILTHSIPPQTDAIELFNPRSEPADISFWFLSDNKSQPDKFRFPPGTVIAPQGYLVLSEKDFNPVPGTNPSFSFDSAGEEVFLFSANAKGELTGYSDGFGFGAASAGASFGRYANSVGTILFPAQLSSTIGETNAGPGVGPVVISEILYSPQAGGIPFIELENVINQPVNLFDSLYPSNTWRISGIDFTFPENTFIPAKGLLLIIGGEPTAFRQQYGVPLQVQIFGPYPGVLQQNGENLQLQRPGAPETNANGIIGVPYITVDEIRYNNKAPWPENLGLTGISLERVNSAAYGNDPINWHASPGIPSPGIPNSGNRAPQVNAGADLNIQTAIFPVITNVTAIVADDGLPKPPGTLKIKWTQVEGPSRVAFANEETNRTSITFSGAGVFLLRCEISDGELTSYDEVVVTITPAPMSQTLIAAGSDWRYLANGSDQGTEWRNPPFSDQSWPSGKAQLGFGDGDEATTLGFGPDSANKYITYYFRKSLNVSNPSSMSQLTLHVLRDDGAVVYVNGTEVFRSNMPEGEILFNTFASSAASGADETTTFFEKNLDPALLVAGVNLIAVEVHQNSRSSTDISFDLELIGLIVPGNQPPQVDVRAAQQAVLYEEVLLAGVISDDGMPIPPGKTTNLWTMVSGPQKVVIQGADKAVARIVFSQPGSYVFRFTAHDGQASSFKEVTINVIGDDYSNWLAKYFSSDELSDPFVSGDKADPDGDGFVNKDEYLAGTNPRDGSSYLKITLKQNSNGSTTLHFVAAAGKSYSILYTDNIAGGAWKNMRDIDAVTETQTVETTVEDLMTSQTRFYRLVTPRLAP